MKRKLKMVEEFQCPGCVVGSDTKCGSFILQEDDGFRCASHVPGTSMFGGGLPNTKLMLGLPRGFNRFVENSQGRPKITLLLKEQLPTFNKFNIPTWAMIQDNHLFVRCYSPRIDWTRVIVWENSTELPPGAVDVSKFIDEMD